MIITYILIGLILSGVPTYIDIKGNLDTVKKLPWYQWFIPVLGAIFWPVLLLYLWYGWVSGDLN